MIFYLVTSTFEYFPGLPVFHSRDLIQLRGVHGSISSGRHAGGKASDLVGETRDGCGKDSAPPADYYLLYPPKVEAHEQAYCFYYADQVGDWQALNELAS